MGNATERRNDMSQTTIRIADGRDRKFMENIIEKYLYEMSPYTGERMDAVGRYAYPHLLSYFRKDGTDRKLYIIEADGRRVGFAMINKVSPFDTHDGRQKPAGHAEPDWCMAEFTVFPRHRNQGIGREAAELVIAENSGRWELSYDLRNRHAVSLWSDICERHGGTVTEVGETTAIAMFEV